MSLHEQLLRWQASLGASGRTDIAGIVHRYGRLMKDNGVDLGRATLALFTLHPQIQALRYVWHDDERDPGPFPSPALFLRRVHHLDGCTVDEAMMSHGAKDTEPFKRSPFYPVMMGLPKLHFRLERGRKHEYPILDDLAEQGATHYLVYPLPCVDGQMSLVTRAPGGFSDEAIDFIECSLSSLGLLLDGAIKNLILDTVLDCYVGSYPGQEVKHGKIRPGDMLDLQGAIWFSDIRGYSTASQRYEPAEFIRRLNEYYECLVPIIYAHQGEVLKFIGDAVLAIFADADPDNERQACSNAYAAAQAVNRALGERGIEFDHGVGLHVGRFKFGNIGSLRRMDFTVIGNDVNIASRIEAQCSGHKQRLLMSEAFMRECGAEAAEVARVTLKNIAGEFPLYAPV